MVCIHIYKERDYFIYNIMLLSLPFPSLLSCQMCPLRSQTLQLQQLAESILQLTLARWAHNIVLVQCNACPMSQKPEQRLYTASQWVIEVIISSLLNSKGDRVAASISSSVPLPGIGPGSRDWSFQSLCLYMDRFQLGRIQHFLRVNVQFSALVIAGADSRCWQGALNVSPLKWLELLFLSLLA